MNEEDYACAIRRVREAEEEREHDIFLTYSLSGVGEGWSRFYLGIYIASLRKFYPSELHDLRHRGREILKNRHRP